MKVRDLFDSILAMRTSDKMIIPFNSEGQRESVRTGLSREKRRYSDLGGEEDISISKISSKGKLCLLVRKFDSTPGPVIISKTGEVKKVDLNRTIEKEDMEIGVDMDITTDLSEDERIKELMREEGKTEKEIEAFFNREVKK